jgi:hypothetical protein
MSPEIEQPKERICATCENFGWKPDNPKGFTWAYCEAKKKWFPDNIQKPGERKGCEEWT